MVPVLVVLLQLRCAGVLLLSVVVVMVLPQCRHRRPSCHHHQRVHRALTKEIINKLTEFPQG